MPAHSAITARHPTPSDRPNDGLSSVAGRCSDLGVRGTAGQDSMRTSPDSAEDRPMARDRQDTSFVRRQLLKTVGAAALLGAAGPAAAATVEGQTYPVRFRGMPGDGPGRPRICLGAPANADEGRLRRLKQIGVSHVLMGGPPAPWKEDELKSRMDRFKAGGIEIVNMMIGGFNDVIWGGPKADEQTANVVESIKVAGKLGLPVIEYNFY